MTYSAKELSVHSAQPVEIYDFVIGTTHYRYTSAESDVVESGYTYTAVTISRSEIIDSSDFGSAELSVMVAYNHPIAELYKAFPPSEVLNLTISRYHRGDAGLAVIWLGRVLNCGGGGTERTLICEPIASSIKQVGLRQRYGPMCGVVLYGVECTLLKEDFVLDDVVVSVSGVTVEANDLATEADGWFNGGYLTWSKPGGITERRSIMTHVGTIITLNYPAYTLAVGDTISVYPGCAHNTTDCGGKFNNLDNYRGWPFVPSDGGPFNGKTVY